MWLWFHPLAHADERPNPAPANEHEEGAGNDRDVQDWKQNDARGSGEGIHALPPPHPLPDALAHKLDHTLAAITGVLGDQFNPRLREPPAVERKHDAVDQVHVLSYVVTRFPAGGYRRLGWAVGSVHEKARQGIP